MLVAAVLVPDTLLLLPGVAGRGPDDPALVALRSAAAAAVARVTASGARVVVVAPGRVDRSVAGAVPFGAAAAGVPDHLLHAAVPVPHLGPAPGGPPGVAGPAGAGAVVGARLALDAGVPAARLHVVEVTAGPSGPLRAVGVATTEGAPTVLVVVGSGSARHSADAPLPHDERAAAFDGALQAAFAAGGATARDALADVDARHARELAVTGWAPWQVLVGALDAAPSGPGEPCLEHAVVWRGAAHAVVTWEVAP